MHYQWNTLIEQSNSTNAISLCKLLVLCHWSLPGLLSSIKINFRNQSLDPAVNTVENDDKIHKLTLSQKVYPVLCHGIICGIEVAAWSSLAL